MAKHHRPFTGGQFALELDGSMVGFLTSVDGGHLKSEEVKNMVGSDNYLTTKYPGKPKYEDITITVGMASSPDFWKWIKTTVEDKPERRNGAIVIYDFKHRERQRRTFYNALISEIGFPALDATSKQAATITIKISPERIKLEEPQGTRGSVSYGHDELAKQKLWLCSNFNFSLDRFKGDTSLKNAKLEGFTLKQGIMMNPIGRHLDTHKYAGRLEKPSLSISFPQSQIKPWVEWYDTCVRHGNYIGEMTNGVITYYASNLKTELMNINLENVGITSVEFDKLESHKEGIAKAKVSLYVETMHLEKGDGTLADD
jgi:phage tail-like protein